jgi:alkanesulfonate monooxygenase SsuD/methylene tetrahydromethanopterin reductase-like flavin-dependent oxidoreductase (luciferase family)
VGLEPSRRVGRLLDTVDVLRALWTGESVSIEGRTLAIREWMTRPTPLQPRPRIWFGGHHPEALRRAVELGDGWIEAGSTSQSDFVREIAVVREHLAAVGRDEATFGLGKRLYLGVERRGRNILQETRHWFAHGYGRAEMADRVAVIGPPSRVTEGVLDILAQGARLVILNPLIDEAAQLRLLAEEVVPAVREALRAQGLANPHHLDPVVSVGSTVSAH